MSDLATIRIRDPQKPEDYVIINESDFDASVHERWEEPADEQNAPQDPTPPAATEPQAGAGASTSAGPVEPEAATSGTPSDSANVTSQTSAEPEEREEPAAEAPKRRGRR